MTWEEYVAGELEYYEQHPEEDCELEAHTNGIAILELAYPEQDS